MQNEIILLAYYIAAINIEAVYHTTVGGAYQPFEGICLTDTFQLYEKEDLLSALLVDNSARRKRQKKLDIQVIIGNPPYSVGQASANDNNQNIPYPHLDRRITDTYAARTTAALSKGLYDSYIRAIRWASDRIGTRGVIGLVTNAGFLEANTADGLRKCLAEEFSSIYVFHLRGNQSTTMGELSRKEGGKIFGSGSRTPIAISLLVKNSAADQHGQIYFHDIGDYLSREEKLDTISKVASIAGISESDGWKVLAPDQHGDWLKQRDHRFGDFIVLGDKRSGGAKLFENFSLGVVTNRDAWCYNFSAEEVSANMKRMIAFYNSEVIRFDSTFAAFNKKVREDAVDDFVDTDPTRISWTRGLKQELVKARHFDFDESCLIQSVYRPFTKEWLYYNRRFNEMVLQMPRIFPDSDAENKVIWITGIGTPIAFTCFMSDTLPDLQGPAKNQCFPLYLYEHLETKQVESGASSGTLLDAEPIAQGKSKRRYALTDEGLTHFQSAYPGERINKEDLFYYVYGILHSPDYRERYADNLSKELPRIPCVRTAADFWAFSQAGRNLAKLHLGYEKVEMYPVIMHGGDSELTDADYRVERMRYGRLGRDKDLTSLRYNDKITLTGVPLEAYAYVINGKPALDWVVERQRVTTDNDSGIVNDANKWSVDTMHNSRYPLELFQRVITVSLETLKIVKSLPALEI
jgi:predicted helicase